MILITGIKGYLASYLLDELLQTDECIGLGRQEEVLSSGIKVYNNLDQIKQLPIHTVFHLASFIPYGKYDVPDQRFITDNIALTLQLVQTFSSARFVFASSVSVYGQPLSNTIQLESSFNNPTIYGLSKLAGETIVKQLKSYGIVRFSSIIGPKMKMNSFIPIICSKAKNEGNITILGKGERLQNYIDVRDAAILLKKVANSSKNILTLGISKNQYSNENIAKIVQSIVPCQIEFKGEDKQLGFVYEWPTILNEIEFEPTYTIEKTLSDIIYEL